MNESFGTLKENGFILSRENLDFRIENNEVLGLVHIITTHTTDKETLVLMRRKKEEHKASSVIVGITEDWVNFSWLPLLQNAMRSGDHVIIYSQKKPLSGIVGLFNCIQKEPGGDNVRCVFVVDDDAPAFNPNLAIYKNQLDKNMAMNVYKDGKWGTYRHLLLNNENLQKGHCFVNITVRGDLSSLRWIEGPLSTKAALEPGKTIVNVSCYLYTVGSF